jgi:hypothetical protein
VLLSEDSINICDNLQESKILVGMDKIETQIKHTSPILPKPQVLLQNIAQAHYTKPALQVR